MICLAFSLQVDIVAIALVVDLYEVEALKI
jgi:hypothetical protein